MLSLTYAAVFFLTLVEADMVKWDEDDTVCALNPEREGPCSSLRVFSRRFRTLHSSRQALVITFIGKMHERYDRGCFSRTVVGTLKLSYLLITEQHFGSLLMLVTFKIESMTVILSILKVQVIL